MTSADGRVYKGEFKNDMKNGSGILITANGKEIKGIWTDGERLG